MKRHMLKLSAIMFAVASLCSCNRQVFDFRLKFTKAVVRWPDGSVKEIEVKKWCDYEGDQIQIIDHDGRVYLLHSNNVVLMSR